MKFDCSECGQRLVCGSDLAGEVVKCPQCGVRLTIPTTEESESDTKQRMRQRSQSRSHRRQWSDSTNVSMPISCLIGIGLMLGFYIFMLPLRSYYFGQLFLARGWVPFALVFLMGWSIGFLILKFKKIGRQKNALLLDMLPESIAEEIDGENVEEFIEHVHRMPARVSESFMANRIRKGLEHFAVRQSNPEVATMMMAQSELDAASVSSSYDVVKVFIWAIPILGFIGTVLGISNAVGGFSGALDQAQDIEVLKTSLNSVTSGLAVAFDTTLVALVMSLLVSFPVSIIQKREEDFLGQVDEYCSENLLKRLNDAGGMADVADNTKVMMQALGSAMAQNQGNILSGLKEAQEKMALVNVEQVKYYEDLNSSMRKLVDNHRQSAEKSLDNVSGSVSNAVTELTKRVKDLVENQVKTTSESALLHQRQVAETLERVSAPLDKAALEHLAALKEGLSSLNSVLKDIGSKQVVVQRASWWRGLFSKKGE